MAKRILLADDSVTIQKVVNLTFAGGDYEVTAVANGEEAIRTASSLRPDIILADISMPGKNGYEVCAAIKEDPQLKDTPVLLLAGTFEPLDPEEAARVKADGHIVKPFESKELVSTVDGLIARHPVKRGGEPETAAAVKPSGGPVDFSGEWGEGDVISAPEPDEEEAGEKAPEVPDLEVFEGRGSAGEVGERGIEQEAVTSGEEVSGGVAAPDMATPAGETEGEAAFNVEGFEVQGFETNPFEAAPEKEGLAAGEAETAPEWKIEDEVIAAAEETGGRAEGEVEAAGTVETGAEEILDWSSEGEREKGVVEEETPAEAPEEPAHEEIEEKTEEEAAGVEGAETAAAGAPEEIEQPVEEEVIVDEEAAGVEPLAGPEAQEPEEGAAAAGAVTLPEEKIEEIVREVAREVIEGLARSTVPEIAREMIAEEISRFKETLTKPKQ